MLVKMLSECEPSPSCLHIGTLVVIGGLRVKAGKASLAYFQSVINDTGLDILMYSIILCLSSRQVQYSFYPPDQTQN